MSNEGNVPIIGQKVEILVYYPTAVIRCRCNPDPLKQTIMTLVGFGMITACPQCGLNHHIQGVRGLEVLVSTTLPQRPM